MLDHEENWFLDDSQVTLKNNFENYFQISDGDQDCALKHLSGSEKPITNST